MSSVRSNVLSAVLLIGLVCIFVGERLIGSGTARLVLSIAGGGLVALACLLRLVRSMSGDAQRRSIERLFTGLTGVAVLGLVVYGVQVFVLASGSKLAPFFAAGVPLLIASSIIPTVLAEMAYASVARAPRMEVRRVRDAALSGVGLVGALTFALGAGYVADALDPSWDFSYFRTAKPGEATHKLIRNLDSPLDVFIFFPPANDVRLEVSEYFHTLEPESSRLHVQTLDAAVDLAKAKELGVVGNGAIVFKNGTRKETLLLALELERARGELRKLDQQVQEKIFAVSRPRRVIYATTGHGERSIERGSGSSVEGRAHISSLRKLIESLNQEVKPLSAADGLATEIPSDAGAVLIVGPTMAFLPEEVSALDRYFVSGGRMIVALDPDVSVDFEPLLAPTGVSFQHTILVNDRFNLPRTHTMSDRALLITNSYSSHPVVTSLSESERKYPLFFPVAGYLEQSKAKPAQVSLDFAVRTHAATFNDLNGNFEQDVPLETRQAWPLVAAASRKNLDKPGQPGPESRGLVLADSDCLADGVVETVGNANFALDSLKWIIGEEAVAGTVNKETDIRIDHSRSEDTTYFYSTIFGVPALVLGAGLFGTRRRRQGRKA